MAEAATFPDVELWATGYLRGALDARSEPYATGVKVDHKVPSPIPTRLVQVRRDGGPQLNPVLEVARLTVNVWAATEKDVTDLTSLVRALLAAAPGDGAVKRVANTSGPSPVPDSTPRRTFVVELTIRRGSILTI